MKPRRSQQRSQFPAVGTHGTSGGVRWRRWLRDDDHGDDGHYDDNICGACDDACGGVYDGAFWLKLLKEVMLHKAQENMELSVSYIHYNYKFISLQHTFIIDRNVSAELAFCQKYTVL